MTGMLVSTAREFAGFERPPILNTQDTYSCSVSGRERQRHGDLFGLSIDSLAPY